VKVASFGFVISVKFWRNRLRRTSCNSPHWNGAKLHTSYIFTATA